MELKKKSIVLLFALIGWLICASLMGVGMRLFPMQVALIIHAVGGTIAFGILSFTYHKKFNYTRPLMTALVFIGFTVLVDFFLVALIVNKSLDMFKSPLGTWIPFASIFVVTYLMGIWVNRRMIAHEESGG